MPDIKITSTDLSHLQRRLKAAGAGDLRKELLRGFRTELKPGVGLVRESARANLPRTGGLAERVAKSSFGVRTRLTGASVGVEIRGTGKRGARGLRSMNEGKLRHPVWGNRKVWKDQAIEAGWFSDPLEARRPQYLSSVQRIMRDVAKKIGKPL
jgi:hypothetical protein